MVAWVGMALASEVGLDIEQLQRDASISKKAYRCAAIAYGAQAPEIEREARALLEVGERALATAHAVSQQQPIAENQNQRSYLELLKSRSLEFWSGVTLAHNIRDIFGETGGSPKFDAAAMDMATFRANERARALHLNDMFISENCAGLLP
jgi:hypothetical protein